MREEDRKTLEALRQARDSHEDLAEFLDLRCALAELQFDAKERIPNKVHGRDESVIRQRLENGVPLLAFDELVIDPSALSCLVTRIVDALASRDPDWAEVADGCDTPMGDEIVALAKRAFEDWDVAEPETSCDGLLARALQVALVPYVEHVADILKPRIDQALWLQGYCPVCGAAPNLALLADDRGARHLVCSRCSTQWLYVRLKCPFCETVDHAKLKYYPSEDGVYRLYVCDQCMRYLKTVDLRQAHRAVVPAVERLVTVAMDLGAQQNGYGER